MDPEMNETLTSIMSRRSIRQYKPEQIADAELQEILDAALAAPTAMNQQKWHFSVVQDGDLLSGMVKTIKDNMINSGIEFLAQRAGDPDFNPFYGAPTIVVVAGDEKGRFIQLDCAMAAENIALAAESINIGSCVMTSPIFLFASDNGDEWKNKLGIPENYNYVCSVTLGYKEGEKPPMLPRNKDVINIIK
jgi:nitroreductase